MSLTNDREIPNDEFRAAISAVVNTWFRAWRDNHNMTDQEWNDCISELTEIGKRYDYKVIHMIGAALVEEIERRQNGNAN